MRQMCRTPCCGTGLPELRHLTSDPKSEHIDDFLRELLNNSHFLLGKPVSFGVDIRGEVHEFLAGLDDGQERGP